MNPCAQSARDVKNTDKSVKVIQKLPHCLCFLFFFYLKNTLKSNKSTENRWKFELQYSIYNMILLIKPTFSNISNILSPVELWGEHIHDWGFRGFLFIDQGGDGSGGADAGPSALRLVCRFQKVFFAPPFHVPVVDSSHVWGRVAVKEQQQQRHLYFVLLFHMLAVDINLF